MNDKKKNGKFYTPDPATQLLCAWAIRSPEDTVLEPSFGGCGFLVSARDRLAALGSTSIDTNLFGCDVDPDAFSILERTLGGDYHRRNFLLDDFLALGRGAFGRDTFTAIIGNPPYVSLHNMGAGQRERARLVLNETGGLSAKASLWAYFVLHANTFLECGGRAAWVLPGSFLHSEYAVQVRTALQSSFTRCVAIELKQRLFLTEGTEESTVIVLCDGYGLQSGAYTPMRYVFREDLTAAARFILEWQKDEESGTPLCDKPRFLSLSPEQQHAYGSVLSRGDVVSLGDRFVCRIGVVTGSNSFFVIRPSDAHRAGLSPADYRTVLGKFRDCRGLSFSKHDISARVESDQRCLLVSSYADKVVSSALLRYLHTFPEEKRVTNRTFQKRTPWHAADDARCPDAFFPIMQTEGPRIVVNEAQVNATNSVYRLYQTSPGDIRLIALSMLSTFSQLGAEIHGRSYGSGGLKMEPSEVARIPVIASRRFERVDVDREFYRVHRLLAAGNETEARRIVDAMLFTRSEREQHRALKRALSESRHRRHRDSKRDGTDAIR